MKHWLINPTWRCQNNCSYCWMKQTVAKRPELYTATERPVEDWYNALYRERPEVVDIAGGEPLLLDWIPELIWACDTIKFGLSTNGLHKAGIDKLCSERLGNLVSINISYHPETKASNYIDRWMDAVTRLHMTGYHVHCNVVKANDNVEMAQEAIERLTRLGVPFELSPYEIMSTLGTKLSQGLLCEGGVDHLVVAPDGTAWPCLTTLRSPFWKETIIGNWLDNTVDVSRKEQPCHLNCVDYYVLPAEHSSGDMWGCKVRIA